MQNAPKIDKTFASHISPPSFRAEQEDNNDNDDDQLNNIHPTVSLPFRIIRLKVIMPLFANKIIALQATHMTIHISRRESPSAY